jgi:hypothetical protein
MLQTSGYKTMSDGLQMGDNRQPLVSPVIFIESSQKKQNLPEQTEPYPVRTMPASLSP